jgi:hypothetical protein
MEMERSGTLCRLPGRRRMGVGFKIELGGDIPTRLHCDETQASLRRGFFCTEKGAPPDRAGLRATGTTTHWVWSNRVLGGTVTAFA